MKRLVNVYSLVGSILEGNWYFGNNDPEKIFDLPEQTKVLDIEEVISIASYLRNQMKNNTCHIKDNPSINYNSLIKSSMLKNYSSQR